MIVLYRAIFNVILILSPIIFFIRFLKKKETLTSYKQKILINYKTRQKGNLIWFHGASVGEIKSIVPLLEKLEDDGKQIDPHLCKEECEELVESGEIHGCGKPFQIIVVDGKVEVLICDYI